MKPGIVLASGSASRRQMLMAAGLVFNVIPSSIDEAIIKRDVEAIDPVPSLKTAREIAQRLALAKAADVASRQSDTVVIGADQTLALLISGADGDRCRSFDKPAGAVEARAQLAEMRGRTHVLCSAVAVVAPGHAAWTIVEEARLTMRDFSDAFLDSYLKSAGDAVCTSVGAYQLEGPGIQLFERIDGDYFTILGMPLLPLLGELRRIGALPA